MKSLTVFHQNGMDEYAARTCWDTCRVTEIGGLIVVRPDDTSRNYAPGYWSTYETKTEEGS